MDKMSLQKSSNRYGLSIQKKKVVRAVVGGSVASTKYNTIGVDTASVTFPHLKSQKDVNVLDSEEFKQSQHDVKLAKMGSNSRLGAGLESLLADSHDYYSGASKAMRSPLATLDPAPERHGLAQP